MTQSVFAAEAKFEVSLDKDQIALGEAAQLGLSFYGTQSMPAPDIGNIDGLEIRYLGPSTMMTVINGQVSSSITHMYRVTPLKIGKFQLGPFNFKYKNTDYASNMVFLSVSEERIAPKAPAATPVVEKLNLEDRLFVVLDVGKTSAFVNELIPIKVKLYVSKLNVSDIQLPSFSQEGFSKIEFKEPKQYRETLNGGMYDVLEFSTMIFGTRPGEYRIGPARIKCNLVVAKKSSPQSQMDEMMGSGSSARDSFFEGFYTHYEKEPAELKSQDVKLAVLPLPAKDRPKDFSGAVGDYQFIYNASSTKVKAGDPISVKMAINGTGNFNTVLMPRIDNITGFKVYEPDVKTEENSKEFIQVFIPDSDLVTQIPQATFNYFDPNKKEYKVIAQGPIQIQVEKSKEEAPSRVVGPLATPAVQRTEETEGRDIIYIKEAPGRWLPINRQVFKGRPFIAFTILPLLFLVSLYIVQSRKERFARDTAYASRLRAFKTARTGLKLLKYQVKSAGSKEFYETVFKTLQEYLGNRLLIPPAGITFDVVNQILVSKGIDLDIIRKVKSLFIVCDEARYAFRNIDSYKMHDDLKELEDIMKYLERKRI